MELDREGQDQGQAGVWDIALAMRPLDGFTRDQAGSFLAGVVEGWAAAGGVAMARAVVAAGGGGTGFPLSNRRAGLAGKSPPWRRRLGLMRLRPKSKR